MTVKLKQTHNEEHIHNRLVRKRSRLSSNAVCRLRRKEEEQEEQPIVSVRLLLKAIRSSPISVNSAAAGMHALPNPRSPSQSRAREVEKHHASPCCFPLLLHSSHATSRPQSSILSIYLRREGSPTTSCCKLSQTRRD